jgi:hypothetical protein
MFKKKLVQKTDFNTFYFSIVQPNFLVFTWCGEFGDRVSHPGLRSSLRSQKFRQAYSKSALKISSVPRQTYQVVYTH